MALLTSLLLECKKKGYAVNFEGVTNSPNMGVVVWKLGTKHNHQEIFNAHRTAVNDDIGHLCFIIEMCMRRLEEKLNPPPPPGRGGTVDIMSCGCRVAAGDKCPMHPNAVVATRITPT